MFQIQYSMNQIQMRFLRLLSRRVSQNVTYHCYNSRAWEHDGRAIKVQGNNGMELTSSGKTKPVVMKNECTVSADIEDQISDMTSEYEAYSLGQT